jgi:small subunit ribosomal protein S20
VCARERSQPLAGWRGKFNLISTLSGLFGWVSWFQQVGKSLTVENAPFIRRPMAAGAIPPPLFFERRLHADHIPLPENGVPTGHPENTIASIARLNGRRTKARPLASGHRRRIFESMANTTSAKKATRKIARRTIINKSRRTQMRGAVRTVEEAIKSGDRDAAIKAMSRAEPELMQAAQRNIIHKNNASRKVSRLAHQIAKLAK